ncbi:uncharacterized protein LOC111622690 [Centruroides sculpturatus]|uniref:uncharacterized protein LOC111622687 n=1 Tax=Centruroides sculpturatus TaxID=218467 RepID=UPI000C6E6B13|nr:uncharacterized protein LOC111622687 [Centruroides sculpturatus]XP_023220881.1 uncharacterized protein LOC111622689 [Centruroides sculpturatus]XP_023220882.1 uncharacterized protein LOC111622690 [Centruroides sculpturatus]
MLQAIYIIYIFLSLSFAENEEQVPPTPDSSKESSVKDESVTTTAMQIESTTDLNTALTTDASAASTTESSLSEVSNNDECNITSQFNVIFSKYFNETSENENKTFKDLRQIIKQKVREVKQEFRQAKQSCIEHCKANYSKNNEENCKKGKKKKRCIDTCKEIKMT